MSRQPLYRTRPAFKVTNGDLAAQVGTDLGLTPDPEQQWLLDTIYAEKAPEVPAAFEVVVVAPRQNLKSATLEIAALADAYVFAVPLHIWTAHELATAQKSFQDMRNRIVANPDYDGRTKFMEGHVDMSITVSHEDAPDSVIEFNARTGKGGRGFTCDKLTLDEGLFMRKANSGAIVPTLVTRPGAQIRYGSSAGLVGSDVLRALRTRGRAKNGDPRLAYVEYGTEPVPCLRSDCDHVIGTRGCALDNTDLWWDANCGMWAGRITEEAMWDQRRSLEPGEFMREFLSWWEDPVSVGGALAGESWKDLAHPDAARGDNVVFGVDVAEDRAVWVAVAWRLGQGRRHVMLVNKGRSYEMTKLGKALDKLQDRWGGVFVPSRSLEKDLEKAGISVAPMPGQDWPEACRTVEDLINAALLQHGNQPALNHAVETAAWRSAGPNGEKAFVLKGKPESGPLAAATRALWGLDHVDVDTWGFYS